MQTLEVEAGKAPGATANIPGEDADYDATVLLFRLDNEVFAAPISAVNEIIDPQPMTPVPNADALAPQIINVRGSIIPLFDIRARLGMKPSDVTPTSRMIVFEQTSEDGDVSRLAFCADSVERVIERGTARLDPLPGLGVTWPPECLAGSMRNEGELVICLDPNAVFNIDHLDTPRSALGGIAE